MGDFSFALKEESEDECLTKRGREFRSSGAQAQCIERISPPGSFCPSQVHGRCEHRWMSEDREKEGRDHPDHPSHSLRLSVFQLWILALTALRPHLSIVTPTPRVKAVPPAVS